MNSKIFNSEALLPACFKALAGAKYQVVLSTGHHNIPKNAGALPENFRMIPYVPGLLMAKRSDLLMHHGGYGSCQTGLFTGKPSLILPTFSERESNARRIANLGAGEYILRSRGRGGFSFDSGEIASKVEKILTGPAYFEHAVTLGEKLRQYGGAGKAADLIEDFVK